MPNNQQVSEKTKNSLSQRSKHCQKLSVNALGDYVKLPNPGLRAYFEHVANGNSEEYRTKFFSGKSLEEVLKGWTPTLSKIGQQWPTLLEFENDLAKKVGPMSIMKPLQDRYADVDHYYDCISSAAIPLDPRAIDLGKQWFKEIRGLRIRSQDKTVANMRLSTNSGTPFFTKRKRVVEDTLPLDVSTDSKSPLHSVKLTQAGHQWSAAAILGWRGQEGGPNPDDVKQRVVWMMPMALNIAELQVYQPFIDACQNKHLVPAWESMEAVDATITKLFDTKGKDDVVICTDFSKFDQHFNVTLADAAKEVFAYILDNSGNSTGSSLTAARWLAEVYPAKYCIPLLVQQDQIYTGVHGMASGSGGTNADETVAHRCLQYEAALKAGKVLNPNSQCLGDDGILSYPGITVEDVIKTYCSHGLEMNETKQYVSKQDCVYLRRWHHEKYRVDGVCVGVYSTCRALGRLCEQERYYDPEVWSKEMVALRQLSILENCKYHPLFTEFVDYCMKGDKYRLGLDIPGFFDKLQRIADKAIDLLPDFLGYTKTMQDSNDNPALGINNWAVVKYLKSKLK